MSNSPEANRGAIKRKADDAASTPVLGSATQPTRRQFSNAPRPVTPIRLDGPLATAPQNPPDGFEPPVPSGFVAFASIPKALAANADAWRVPRERIPSKMDLQAYAQPIEKWLEANREQAVGISEHNGSLLWAPDATWRMAGFVGGKKFRASVAAMHGGTVEFPGVGGMLRCYPILSCRGLALAFGAKRPPEPPPQFVLGGIRHIDRSERTLAGATERPKHDSQGNKLGPFDPIRAKRLLVSANIGSQWRGEIPKEAETRRFLGQFFKGIPNDPHRQIRREVWPDLGPGPRRKPTTAEIKNPKR